MTLEDYLDLAIRRHDLKSDRELSFRLGFMGGTQVYRYRRKGDFPTPAAMIRLAALCGLDPKEALIDLQMWKENDQAAMDVLARIKEIVRHAGATAAVLLVAFAGFVFAALDPDVASAGTKLERTAPAASQAVYYGK